MFSVIAVTTAGKSWGRVCPQAFWQIRRSADDVRHRLAVAIAVPMFKKLESKSRLEVLLPGLLSSSPSRFLIHLKLEGWTIPLLHVWMEVITVYGSAVLPAGV
jgi:hypothetical protein